MVCSTYRPGLSPLRLFGAMHLVEESKSAAGDQSVKLAIVDSSPVAHPFFTHPEAFLEDHGILYLHMPKRNGGAWRNRFTTASKFIPDDNAWKTPLWQERHQDLKAWGQFLFFTEEFRKIYKGPQPSDFMHFERPCIGMKKNAGIAVLSESFGEADNIIFCDDDDRHHPNYIRTVSSYLENADFVRMRRWLTLKVAPDANEDPLFGMYDIPFQKDRNGMWSVPPNYRDTLFHSTLKNPDGSEFRRTVGSKFSIPLCMGWPPLGHEGALHNYKYDTWKKAVEEFGGCVPTSFCEDMLLHKFCADRLDSFNVVQIENDTPLFIRCSDGTNASEVEWTEDVHNDHPYHWAHGVASEIRREISTPISPERIQKAGNEFLQTGTTNWALAVQSVPAFRSRIENVLTPKPPSPF